jgi:uncharacterized membrane protein
MLRQAAAFLALTGLFVSAYLWLYSVGAMGTLACGVGSCEVVQTSPYAYLFGVPVSGWGVLGYAAILGVALAGTRPAWARGASGRGLAFALAALAGAGFAFSTYLTTVELFVLRAVCMWCVISYALITAIFALALVDLRRRRADTLPTRDAASD